MLRVVIVLRAQPLILLRLEEVHGPGAQQLVLARLILVVLDAQQLVLPRLVLGGLARALLVLPRLVLVGLARALRCSLSSGSNVAHAPVNAGGVGVGGGGVGVGVGGGSGRGVLRRGAATDDVGGGGGGARAAAGGGGSAVACGAVGAVPGSDCRGLGVRRSAGAPIGCACRSRNCSRPFRAVVCFSIIASSLAALAAL